MKLTKLDKEAFVQSVMDDVPMVDYDEQAAKLMTEWSVAQMPKDVMTVFKKHPDWLKTCPFNLPRRLRSCHVISNSAAWGELRTHTELWEKLEAIGDLDVEQGDKVRALRGKVSGMINGCTTLKQAQERLPEFIKYLPTERDGFGTANLPAIANVVTDLVTAGWPKGKANAL